MRNMDNVFLDTDVCLDIITRRLPFYTASNEILRIRKSTNRLRICISESCIPNLIYFTTFKYKIANPNTKLMDWLNTSRILSAGNKSIFLQALESRFKDKEDAIQYFTAVHNDVDYFITRNKKDYEKYTTSLPVYTPSEFLEIVS